MGKIIDYRLVDLGLPSGLKWADRNVGAENIQDYGDYFMWSSVTPDTNYVCDWAHAPFNGGREYFDEEYFNKHKSEWLTEDGTLKPVYDAAYAAMGGSWRMPTSEEMQELLDETTRSAEELNGVKGVRFTSKTNGNSIFMPFSGRRDGSVVNLVGNYGYAWSSFIDSGSTYYSQSLYFDYDGSASVNDHCSYYGFVVRGVHD